MVSVTLHSEADTAAFAKQLSHVVRLGDSVGLSGDLGAGKTTFVRYFVEAYGGDAEHVSSPSYSLQNEYRLPERAFVEHWDLYRLQETPLELLELPEEHTIRLVEWPERCSEVYADISLHLTFTVQQDGRRIVVCSGTRALEVKGSS
jgi:tRNA threonylcarbamoyladenosine biosynthesis protein TsaE